MEEEADVEVQLLLADALSRCCDEGQRLQKFGARMVRRPLEQHQRTRVSRRVALPRLTRRSSIPKCSRRGTSGASSSKSGGDCAFVSREIERGDRTRQGFSPLADVAAPLGFRADRRLAGAWHSKACSRVRAHWLRARPAAPALAPSVVVVATSC